MPSGVPSNCIFPGCPVKVESGSYCARHKYKSKAFDKFRDNRQQLERSKFRSSASWRRLSAWTLRHEPLCRLCGLPATQVDHILPISKGGPALDSSNLQPLCASCHSIKTRVENR